MMSRLGNWLQASTNIPSQDELRAINLNNIVQDKPTTVIIRRNGTNLAPQIFRIEYLGQAFEQRGSHINKSSREPIVLIAARNHPDQVNVPNPDCIRGDRFFLQDYNQVFSVVHIDYTNNWLFSATAIAQEDT